MPTPESNNPYIELEWVLVLDMEAETSDCIRLDFEHDSVGFPPDHEVRVLCPEMKKSLIFALKSTKIEHPDLCFSHRIAGIPVFRAQYGLYEKAASGWRFITAFIDKEGAVNRANLRITIGLSTKYRVRYEPSGQFQEHLARMNKYEAEIKR